MKQNLEAPNSIQEITPTMSNQLIDQDNPILITNASHNFYKTKICPYFLMVRCSTGKMHKRQPMFVRTFQRRDQGTAQSQKNKVMQRFPIWKMQ
jgi:hypothetical protein